MLRFYLPTILVVLLLFGFFPSSLHAQIFQDISASSGIIQGYGSGGKGGGVSFYDFNGDGWDDLSFATQIGDSLVFLVNQNGTFSPTTLNGIGHMGAAEQLLWVDYDNDGDADLFVTDSEGPNILYQNQGEDTYVDVTSSAGLSTRTSPTYAACWGDINLDGLLDLYVTNWGTDDSSFVNRMYLNTGDGFFEDITERAGASNPNNPPLAVMFVDINHDQYPDIYIANDHLFGNTMFLNNGDESFTDISVSSGTDLAMDGMGVTAADYDLDGDLDLYASNSPYGNALFRNEGNETFTEVAATAGVALYGTGWGVNFLDFDNDMDQDLYASAFYVPIPSIPHSTLFDNQGNGSFNPVASNVLVGDQSKSYGNAIGDIDQDGYYDMAVNNADPDNFQIWLSSGGDREWISLELQGSTSNRDGVGSWIEVVAGGVKQIHFTHCGTSYISQNSKRVNFGLGNENMIDSVIVLWPSGIVDVLTDVSSQQTLTILEGSHPITTSIEQHLLRQHLSVSPNPANDQVQLEWKGEASEILSLQLLNVQGQVLMQEQIRFDLSSSTHHLQVGDLANGLYFLHVEGADQVRMAEKIQISH